MRVWKQIVLGLTTLVGMAGCSTDLEVNAPYKEITVVYGLLNRTDRIHWVRINRAFLGTDNAFVYANIPDSSEYTDAQLQNAVVEELDNGSVVNTYALQDSILNNRVDGVFYNPVHKIYYFRTTSDLDQDNEFRLRATAKGNAISSTTDIVDDFLINATDGNANVKIGLVNNNGNYLDYELNWTSGKDGRRYQVDYVFKYTEVRNGTDSTNKFVSVRMGTRITGGLNGGEALNATIDGQSFFENLSSVIQDDPSVEKRVIKGMDFSFWVASDDFHTYLQLADPVSGIVEERPDFTNVTSGYGLFGGRYFKGVNNKQFSNETVNELVNGQFTGTLRFCSPLTSQVGLSCN